MAAFVAVGVLARCARARGTWAGAPSAAAARRVSRRGASSLAATLGSRAGQRVPLGLRTSVLPVPVLSDNVARTAAAVDPAEPEKLLQAAAGAGVRISSVLTTHHHWDHAGGNERIVELLGDDLEVVGSATEHIPCANVRLSDGQMHRIKDTSLTVRALTTPCHTRGHVLYHLAAESDGDDAHGGAVFSGDTLFVAGCGRFFEGDAADMLRAMDRIAAELGDDTLVFCGHEYTASNLRFAASVDAENVAVQEARAWADSKLKVGEFTVPSTLRGEKAYNPFMRTRAAAIQAATRKSEPREVMAQLREMKNSFRG